MARLYRPYIPISVRVQVAERQMQEAKKTGNLFWGVYLGAVRAAEEMGTPWTLGRRLRVLLGELFPHGEYQLDHDPALEQRKVVKRNSMGETYYSPMANDPNHLVYRTTAAHLFKTTGRKPGAEKTVTSKGSDVWLGKKFRRLEGKTKPRRKVKIRSRPFQKGERKINGPRT